MDQPKPKVIVVMPAYNAARTLDKTLAELPTDVADEIILVDDASRDGTADLARQRGLTVIQHPKNRGYGGNQKTCYAAALDHGADIIVMLHPDYQYDARTVPYLVNFIRDGYFDVMLGSRIRTRREALHGGMPLYKYISNRFLTFLGNLCLGQTLGDFHTGLRAYRREVLETIDWDHNAEDFRFDGQILAQAVAAGFRLAEVPVPVRYGPDASSINFKGCIRYGLGFVGAMLAYPLSRTRLFRPRLFRKRRADAAAAMPSASPEAPPPSESAPDRTAAGDTRA